MGEIPYRHSLEGAGNAAFSELTREKGNEQRTLDVEVKDPGLRKKEQREQSYETLYINLACTPDLPCVMDDAVLKLDFAFGSLVMGNEQLQFIQEPGAPKGEDRLSPWCQLNLAGHNGMAFPST
ncbi:hypothetical protein TNIN_223341 [Trichonephila inaurata madagascariensis]|uniref:Uncharacterized protein n=1 Tax=Trichonephila inaurata madagascariensis TaxID=2747483 RepID=A0A8X6WWQ3_9ARAC|nr:hypothetical protein TNIN_223341 [Trichonephila inaurata madagascariensis]